MAPQLWCAVAALLCLAVCPAGSADSGRHRCSYFGTGSTTSGDRLVKNTCPPPSNRNIYFFKMDIDPGTTSGILSEAAMVSPADAVCDETTGKCAAPVGPGYDLYVAKGCLPVPAAPGLESMANTELSTRKPISLQTSAYARFYVAAVRRADADGAESCSFSINPGYLGAGTAQQCTILDYTPNATIITSTITTTVSITKFNTTSNHTETASTSDSVVTQSNTAKPGESTGVETTTATIGALRTTTTTTIFTTTVETETPEAVEFCTPPAKLIPPEYVAATVVIAGIAAVICLFLIRRWEARRARRRMCVEAENNFRNVVAERTISQDLAIEHNVFEIGEVVQKREERNLSIRSQRLGSGLLVDNFMSHDDDVEKAPVPGQSSFNPYGTK